MRPIAATLVITLLILGGVSSAPASESGIFDVSRAAGCNCHDYGPTTLPVSPTTVKMLVDGLPAEQFGGFTPGDDYELTVWVVGLVLPFAGFNLEASAGELAADDASVKAIVHTECDLMERKTVQVCRASNPAPGQECKVRRNNACPVFDTGNPDCDRCKSSDPDFENDAVCRMCDGVEIIDIQATHSEPKPLPFFTMTWTAPDDGTSEVTFHLAGNSVEFVVGSTSLDIWNFSDPYPIVLRAAP